MHGSTQSIIHSVHLIYSSDLKHQSVGVAAPSEAEVEPPLAHVFREPLWQVPDICGATGCRGGADRGRSKGEPGPGGSLGWDLLPGPPEWCGPTQVFVKRTQAPGQVLAHSQSPGSCLATSSPQTPCSPEAPSPACHLRPLWSTPQKPVPWPPSSLRLWEAVGPAQDLLLAWPP